MADPINKLIGTCDIVGKECKDLIEKLKKDEINELGFISGYFNLVDKMPDNARKEDTIKELEEFIQKIKG